MVQKNIGRVNSQVDRRLKLWGKLPKALKKFPRWTVWKEIDGAKVPVSPQGKKVDPHEKWVDFETAVDGALEQPGAGIGVVLFEGCGLVAIDLDDTERWEDEAEEILDRFDPHAYIELSPSGNGYHILMDGSVPVHKTRHKTFYRGKVEVYTKARFITVTGHDSSGCPSDGSTREAKQVLRDFVKPLVEGTRDPESDTVQLEGEEERITDEAVLFEMAALATKAENEGAQAFMEIHKYEDAFDHTDDPSDLLSSAVNALLRVTANTAQVERIMKACAAAPNYVDRRTEKPKMVRWLKSELPKMVAREIESRRIRKEERHQQVTELGYESEFVWMGPVNKFFSVRDGCEYGVDALNSTFRHLHSGARGDPFISTLLLESPNLERAAGRVWKPLVWQEHMRDRKFLSASSSMVKVRGVPYVNSWRGYEVMPKVGDVDPWIDLLSLVIPDETLHDHVIRRMAYDVQFPDSKCMWHIMITGVHGAGKDLLFSPLFKIFGNATSEISNRVMKSQYEDEFIGKKILNVQELSGLSKDAYEQLKAHATADPTALKLMNLKGSGKVPTYPIWSFYMTSNHANAMKIEPTERRWLVIESQDRALTQDEVNRFLQWRDDNEGVAKFFNYLLNIDLAGFDPTKTPVRTEALLSMVEATKTEAEVLIDDKMASRFSSLLAPGVVRADVIIARIGQEEGRVNAPTFADVENYLRNIGWRRIRHIATARAKVDGEVKRQPLRTYAPRDSELHSLRGTELYFAIDDLIGPRSDFHDE